MILDLASLLAGSGTTVAGVLIGTWVKGRRAPPSRPALCSCGHGSGTHNGETGACRAQIKRSSRWDSDGLTTGYEWVPCPCLTNDGPEPLAVLEARLARQLPSADL